MSLLPDLLAKALATSPFWGGSRHTTIKSTPQPILVVMHYDLVIHGIKICKIHNLFRFSGVRWPQTCVSFVQFAAELFWWFIMALDNNYRKVALQRFPKLEEETTEEGMSLCSR